MKIGNLELSDWEKWDGDYGWSRYQLIRGPTRIYHGRQLVCLYSPLDKNIIKHVYFYDSLYFCNEIYNPTNKQLKLFVDDAKNTVDKLLLKVTLLKAFI